jgi:Ca2+-binding RTX toxin-like protein
MIFNIIEGNKSDNNLMGDINSSNFNDEIKGFAGDDILDGLTGNNLLRGGDGNDRLFQEDTIVFTDIPYIDLVMGDNATRIRLGDGIAGNHGFGTGELLMTLYGVLPNALTAENFQNTDFFSS